MDHATTAKVQATAYAPGRASTSEAEIHLSTKGPNGGPTAEIFLAEGTTFKGLQVVQQAIYRDLLTAVGLKACEGCRSGLDIIIRERFVDVVRVNVDTGQVH